VEANPPLDFDIENFTYYDYQDELIRTALTKRRGIIKAPTGAGKTLIMAGLVQALRGRKMVILFNAKSILTQSYDFLVDQCGLDNIGICFGEGFIEGDVMLCSVQSIEKILDTHLEEAEVLMVDECHEFANGKTTLAAINSFPNANYRFGLTATLPPEPIPFHNLQVAFGGVIQVVNTVDLIEKGKITKPEIQIIDRAYTASGLDDDMSYTEVYDAYIVNNDSRNADIKRIVSLIQSSNESSKILILVKSLEHGKILMDMLPGECHYLKGEDSISERYGAVNKFRKGGAHQVMIGTKILQTGISIDEITHYINARGMKSKIATIQALGRALRRHESKRKVFVYDFDDKEKYLRDHSKQRKQTYKNEGHTVTVL
jgi:superfamily II DNA or RNA helicase